MNLSQLRRAVWLRRLSDASQSNFTLLKNHHRLGWLPETSEVIQMSFQHLFHPSPGLRDGVVHYPAQLDLDRQ